MTLQVIQDIIESTCKEDKRILLTSQLYVFIKFNFWRFLSSEIWIINWNPLWKCFPEIAYFETFLDTLLFHDLSENINTVRVVP